MFLLSSVGHAHEGHDHTGDGTLPVSTVAPRFEARSDLFELVGIMDGEVLWLYLDKADSNDPIEQASIEIESGSFKGKAVASPGGVFKLSAPMLAKPGQHALTITVEASGELDLLTTTFEMKAVERAEKMQARVGSWTVWAGGVLLLALLVVMVFRMRKRT